MRIYITGIEETIRKINRAEELMKDLKDVLRDLYFMEEIRSEPESKNVIEAKDE